MRKLIFLSILFVSITLNMTACRQASDKKETTVQPTAQVEEEKTEEVVSDAKFTFTQTAKGAILKKLGTRGYYTLTLYNANPYLTYYAERPKRISGLASVDNFIKNWKVGENNFHMNNPNLLLTAATIDGVTNNGSTFYLMTCSTPEYNMQKGILSYVVKPLPAHPFTFEHIQFNYVTVIID